jgi:GT2 family glycosyltransferase
MRDAVCALVINFNTHAHTLRCVRSLLDAGLQRILVLDNASRADDRAALNNGLRPVSEQVHVIESEDNLGFAAGSNLLVEEALRDPANRGVFLLNSDAVLVTAGFEALLAAWEASGAAMLGGRMHALDPATGCDTGRVDSLGIALYRPLLASNRKSMNETFVGPTGGCALYDRALLEALRDTHGYVFDPVYFCYAEDTDLCLRARLLGFDAAYVDALVALHEGQASSGGGFNDFVLYHGIRNSIWTAIKTVPLLVILRNLHWVVLLHFGIVVRHATRGKAGTLWRLYRDAARGMRMMLARRKIIQATRRCSAGAFARQVITPRFYERDYLRNAVLDLLRFRRA